MEIGRDTRTLSLLIVPIDAFVVDYSDRQRLEGMLMLDGDWKGRRLEGSGRRCC